MAVQRHLIFSIKCIIILMLTTIAFINSSFAAVQAIETFVDSIWSNEIYYIASLSGYYGKTVGYDDITIYITAVDKYELYINGERIDTEDTNDNNLETVEEYVVNVSDNVINVAVKVVNNGVSHGNGLIMDIQAGSDQLGTWTKIRESVEVAGELRAVPVAWWTFDSQAKEDLGFGDDWYTLDFQDLFTDVSITSKMRCAMLGKIIGDVNHTFSPEVEIITGYLHSDVDIGGHSEGITLRRIERENIALGKSAQDIKLTDGDLARGLTYLASPLGDTQFIDLGRIYRVNTMTIFTGGDNPADYPQKSLRGYAVEVSLDEFRWEEVSVISEIGVSNAGQGGYDNYTVAFPPEWARYIRYKVTETRTEFPNVGEFMVSGIGYTYEGNYESPWLDFGSQDIVKNFGAIEWDGDIPDGTILTVQTQTKNGVDGLPSIWSTPTSYESFPVASPEPATHFKYRVNLETQDTFRTPTFKKFNVTYSDVNQPVSYADGYVIPNRVAMGADSSFTYILSYSLYPGQDIKHIALSVPGYTTLNQVYSSDVQDILTVDEDMTYSTIDTLYVTFEDPVIDTDAAGADTLYISFNTKLLSASHTFDAFLYNSDMNDGAGGIIVWENRELGYNTVNVSTIVPGILNHAMAVPNVFSPDGDGENDFTVIEFYITKITNVKILIFDSNDALVTTIFDDMLSPSDYSLEDQYIDVYARMLPGYWDGTDDSGNPVPEGLYYFQVIAETDEGDVIETGPIIVTYSYSYTHPSSLYLSVFQNPALSNCLHFAVNVSGASDMALKINEDSVLLDTQDYQSWYGTYYLTAEGLYDLYLTAGGITLVRDFSVVAMKKSGSSGFSSDGIVSISIEPVSNNKDIHFAIFDSNIKGSLENGAYEIGTEDIILSKPALIGFKSDDALKAIYRRDGNQWIELPTAFKNGTLTARTNILGEFKVGEASIKPFNTNLVGNYPNPFNTATFISFYLGSERDIHDVKLEIYSLNGQLVKTLVENTLSSGVHQIAWNGEDRYGNKVSSGLYLYSLSVSNNVFTKNMLFLK